MRGAIDLSSLHVAITGGARGLGAATAERLGREGARIALGDVDVGAVTATAARLGAYAAPLDVTDRESFEAFLDAAEAAQGPIDVLVNNAGIMPIGPFTDEPDAAAHRMVDVNLHGVILGCKLVLPRMLARGGGHVVNVASVAGRIASLPGLATYVATKHAVVGLSEALRCEVEGRGVWVSAVLPNLTQTRLGSGMKPARGARKLTPEEVAHAIADGLRRPRPEIYVPRSLGPQILLSAVTPRRVRRPLQKLLRMDAIASDFDARARADYQARTGRPT
jgi:NAD(P)-dependent dehydrogenase (short-subunit alcohol dehydrogenase family)